MSDFWDNFKAWLNHPFAADMDTLDWFLFLGLLIFLLAVWAIVLRHLRDAMK